MCEDIQHFHSGKGDFQHTFDVLGLSLIKALRFFSPVYMAINSQRKGTVFVPPPSYPRPGGDLCGPDLGATESRVQPGVVLHSVCHDLLS